MKNNSPFDDHIKKQFGNYQPEVPSHIWKNIIAAQEKKKPAGFFFFLRNNKFIFISLALLLIITGVLFVHRNRDVSNNRILAAENRNAEETALNSKPSALKKVQTENRPEINNKENNIAGSNNEHQIPQVQNPSAGSTAPAVSGGHDKLNIMFNFKHKNADSSPAVSFIKNSPDKNVDDKEVNNANGLPENKIIYGEDSGHKGGGIRPGAKLPADAKSKNGQDMITMREKNEGAATGNKFEKNKKRTGHFAGSSTIGIENPGTEAMPVATHEDPQGTKIGSAPFTDADRNDEIFFMKNRYLSLTPALNKKAFSFAVTNTTLTQLKLPCPGSGTSGKRYFEIYGAPDYAFRILSDTAHSSYLQRRKESTRLSSAYSFGIRYTRVFNNSFSIRTGANFSQVNEKFSFEQGHILQMVYITDASGDTTGSYATTGSRYKTTHNRYSTLDIPLELGYEMEKGRFGVNINAGLMINIYSWQKGDVLDTAYQPVNITTGKSTSPYQFKTNAGMGVTGSLSLYYRVTRRFQLLAEPYFRYNFSAANKAEITFKQKYTTAGLRLGVRMDF